MRKISQNVANSTSDDTANRATQGMTHRTLSGLFWMFSGTGFQGVLQVLVLMVLARMLTPKDFGLVGASLVVVGVCEIFSQLGIGPAIVQRPNIGTKHLRTGFTLSLLLGLLLAGLVAILAPTLSNFFQMEDLTPVLRIMALLFVLKGLSVVAASLLQRELRFRSLAGVQVASYTFGYGLVGISLAWLGLGVWSLVGAQLTQAALETLIMVTIQPHPKRLGVEARAFSQLMRFGSGLTVAQMANYFARQGDNLVVGRWLGAEALGLYSRAYHLMTVPATLFGQAVNKVLFPSMAKLQDKPQRLGTAYRRGVALTALSVLPASATMFVLAPEIIQLLLGPKWSGAVVPFQVLALGMIFRVGYKVSGTLARAKGAVHHLAWRQGVYATLVLGGSLIGQSFGLTGVAFGVVGALAVHFFLMAQLSIRLTPLSWGDLLKAHVPVLILAAAVGASAWTVATLLRGYNLSAIVILPVTVAAGLFCVIVLGRLMPVWSIGKDGIWLFQEISNHIPSIINPIKRIKTKQI